MLHFRLRTGPPYDRGTYYRLAVEIESGRIFGSWRADEAEG